MRGVVEISGVFSNVGLRYSASYGYCGEVECDGDSEKLLLHW